MQTEQLQRVVVVLVSVFAVLVSSAVLLLGGEDNDAQARVASPPSIRATAAGENENSAYRQLLEQKNRDSYEQARQQGQSMVATLTGTERIEPDLAITSPPPAAAAAPVIPVLPERAAPRTGRANAAMAQEIRSIMDTWRTTPHEVVLVQKVPPAPATPPVPAPAAVPTPGQMPAVQAGSLLYASLQTAIDSDYPGVVLARVLGSDWDGAQLIGSFRRVHNRVVLEFNRLSLADGRTREGLQAVAIDPQVSLPALKGSVDYHVLHNYILPAAARFASSLGQSVVQGRQTILHGPLGNSTVINDRPGLGEQLAAAGAQIGAGLLTDLGGTRRQPTVRVPAGYAFSVLVLQDLPAHDPAPRPQQDEPGEIGLPATAQGSPSPS